MKNLLINHKNRYLKINKKYFIDTNEIKAKLDQQLKEQKQFEINFNKNIKNINKEFTIEELKSIDLRRNFLNPNKTLNQFEETLTELEQNQSNKEEIKIDLKALSEINFRVIIYEASTQLINFSKLFDFTSKLTLLMCFAYNYMFLFNFTFLFEHTVFAQISLTTINAMAYIKYLFHKNTICPNILELSVNPKTKQIQIYYIRSILQLPKLISVPINKLNFVKVNKDKYEFIINDKKYKNKYFIMHKQNNFYQEDLLCKLYKLNKDDITDNN